MTFSESYVINNEFIFMWNVLTNAGYKKLAKGKWYYPPEDRLFDLIRDAYDHYLDLVIEDD